MEKEKLKQAYRVYKTILEMIDDRNYYVGDQLKNLDEQLFNENFLREGIINLVNKKDDESKKLMIYFEKENKTITVKDIENFAVSMKKDNVYNGIIVSFKPINPQSERLINELVTTKFNIEFFEYKELLVNITKHELVPKHILLNEEEKKKVLEKYRAKESQFPKILSKDPVSRYLGVKRGNMLKILTKSETAGLHIKYRVVA